MALVFDNQDNRAATGVIDLSDAQTWVNEWNTKYSTNRYVVLAEAHEYPQQAPVFPAISQELLANGNASFEAVGEYQTWNANNGHEFPYFGKDLDRAVAYACSQSRGSEHIAPSTTHLLYLIGYIETND